MRTRSWLAGLAALLAARGTAAQQWTVDPKPILDLKGVNEAGTIVFGTASWATRLRNGTVVIADATAPAVHFIAASGKLIRTAGRSGQGPGDFRTVTWVGQCGNGVVYAWDFAQMRITTYDDTGTVQRTFAFGTRGGPQTSTTCNADGTLVQFGAVRRVAPAAPPDPNAGYVIMGMAGAPMLIGSKGDTLVTLPDVPFVEYVGTGRGGGAVPRPLGPVTPVALGSDRFYEGRPDSSLIAVFSLDGRRTGSIALRVTPRAPTAEEYAKAADVVLAMVPAQSRERARIPVMAAPLPSRLPTPSGVLVDPSGVVWAVLTSPGGPDTRLRALRSDGSHAADVTVPINVTVFEVGVDYILGAYTDADDEPHVVVFRLRRGPG